MARQGQGGPRGEDGRDRGRGERGRGPGRGKGRGDGRGRGDQRLPQAEPAFRLSDDAITAILEGNARRLVDEAERVSKKLARVSVQHLRPVAQAVAAARLSDEPEKSTLNRLHLLRPRLAWLAGHPGSRQLDALRSVLDVLLAKARPNQLGSVLDFVEAVVAYHYRHSRPE
jgi:CRISPR type III-A-associated protein Csm2